MRSEYSDAYPQSIQEKLVRTEKKLFISGVKWTMNFGKFVFKSMRLPKMIFKVTSLITKLKRVDLSLVQQPTHAQQQRFSLRYSRMVREVAFQIGKYHAKNILMLS